LAKASGRYQNLGSRFRDPERDSAGRLPPTTMMNRRCIREVCRHSLHLQRRPTIPLKPPFPQTRIGVQLYSTVEISETIIQSSETTTIPSSVPLDHRPPCSIPSPKPEKAGLVPLPSHPCHSDSAFFQYYDQRTSSNQSPQLEYANTVGSANWLLRRIKGRVIGLDLEWRVQGPVNISLVQVCDEHTILLLHLAPMKGFTLPVSKC
jgi:hypothetical protein